MNFPYKLICLDLDGTLFNSGHKIGKETLQTLRSIETSGVKLAIATGRAGFEAQYFARAISKNAYYVAANGAVVGSTADERILFQEDMRRSTIRMLLDISKEIRLYPVFYASDKMIIHHRRDYLTHLLYLLRANPHHFSRVHWIRSGGQLEKALLQTKSGVSKATFFRMDAARAGIAKKRLEAGFELAIYMDSMYEVTEKGMNKSWGIQKLARHLGIQRSEIMAFGDSENDREMLKYVGCGVAMGNASAEIKAIADRVADTNDHEGVAKTLKEVLKTTD